MPPRPVLLSQHQPHRPDYQRGYRGYYRHLGHQLTGRRGGRLLHDGAIGERLAAGGGQYEADGLGGLVPLREVAAVEEPIQASIGKFLYYRL